MVLADPAAVALAAAARIVRSLSTVIAERGRADVATTGGSTPIGIYGHLASPAMRADIDWEHVHIWFGDDRFVPRKHPFSNVMAVDEVLVAVPGAPLPPGNIHPFPCTEAIAQGRDADWCAATYADELRRGAPWSADGWPTFDLVLVGIGPDGHILSVFPGSAALTSPEVALAIPAPTHVEPHVERVTLNPHIVETARDVLAITHGAAKADVIGQIFGDLRDPNRWPAQLCRRPGVTWLLDEDAAARLPARAALAARDATAFASADAD